MALTEPPVSHPVPTMGAVSDAYDPVKFAEEVLHVAEGLKDDRGGGATKLNKVLFFAEFTHLRRHGRAISGCEFQKLPHGPAPRQLLPVRRQLIASGSVELVEEDFLGRPQHRLVPRRAANLKVFTDDELQTISDVMAQLAGMTGTQVSELSHQEPGWRLAAIGETIPSCTALLGFRQALTPTSKRLSESVAQRYGLAAAE